MRRGERMTEIQANDLAIALCVLGLIISAINMGYDAAQEEKNRLKEKWGVK
jgi:hypothetical protein